MKYVKFFAASLSLLLLAACSDKEEFNTATGVTVEMAQSEMTVKENQGLVEIPLKVTGEANGPISVKVEVKGAGNIPAEPYEERNGVWSGNYVVSSETLNIPAGETSVSVEINLLDDLDETGDRAIEVTIVSCEGASIGSVNSTYVTISDNESMPVYDMIQGTWKFNCLDYDGLPSTTTVTIYGYDEGTQEYNEGFLEMEGLLNNPTVLSLYLSYNELNGKYYLSMELPEPIIWYNASNYIWVLGTTASGSPTTASVSYSAEFDKDSMTFTFTPTDKIWFYVASPDFSSQLGVYDTATQMTITK